MEINLIENVVAFSSKEETKEISMFDFDVKSSQRNKARLQSIVVGDSATSHHNLVLIACYSASLL